MTTTSDRDEEEEEMEEGASNASIERRSSVRSTTSDPNGQQQQVRPIFPPSFSLSLITSSNSTPQIIQRLTSTTLSRLLRPTSPVPVYRIPKRIPIILRRIPASDRIRTATLSPACRHIKDRITRMKERHNNSKCIRLSNGPTLPISLPSPTLLDRNIHSPISHHILQCNNHRRGAILLKQRRIGERRTDSLDSLRTADREEWLMEQISQRCKQHTPLATSSHNAHRNEQKAVSLRRAYRIGTTRRCHRQESLTTRHISLTIPSPPIPPLFRRDRILVQLRLLELRRIIHRIVLVCRTSRD